MLTKLDSTMAVDIQTISRIFQQWSKFSIGSKFRILVLMISLQHYPFENPIGKLAKIYSYIDTRHLANVTERDLLKFA